MKTLAIDVGGTGLKAALLDADGNMIGERVKIPTPYPCPPEKLVASLRELAGQLPSSDRVSVGFPGMVRAGLVREVPALSRTVWGGPPDPDLTRAWSGFKLTAALEEAFGRPTRVANDADLQGSAAVTGNGLEFVMTLGTGCGTAVFWQGELLPHMELSHGPFRKGETFDLQLGDAARRSAGNRSWRKRVRKAIAAFDAMLLFDKVYVGGGNATHLKDGDLGEKGTLVPNVAGLLGGIRLWDQPWDMQAHDGTGSAPASKPARRTPASKGARRAPASTGARRAPAARR
jgi:polyphosphate glucokinase